MNSPTNEQILSHLAHNLDVLIEHFGEEITLRELRVRVLLYRELTEAPGNEVSYASIASLTGVPTSTLTRYLTFCLVEKCMTERVDPKDRRRRLLRLNKTGGERMKEFLDDCRNNGIHP